MKNKSRHCRNTTDISTNNNNHRSKSTDAATTGIAPTHDKPNNEASLRDTLFRIEITD